MVMVKAMMAVAMMEVGLILLSLERGDIRGESPDGWSKRTGPQRYHADQVDYITTELKRESWNVGNGIRLVRDETRERTDGITLDSSIKFFIHRGH